MGRKTKQDTIDKLQKRIKELEDSNDYLHDFIDQRSAKSNEDFLKSSLRYELEETLDFYKKLNDLGDANYQSLCLQMLRLQEKVNNLYKDNIALVSKREETYNNNEMFNFDTDHICALEAKLLAKDKKIELLEREIKNYQKTIGEYKAFLPKVGRKSLSHETQKEILALRSKLNEKGNPYTVRQIAQEVGCSIGAVSKYLHNMPIP